MSTPVVVGVDNGGTWIRMIGLDARGRRVWSIKKPSPTITDLPVFLRKHVKDFHGKLEGLAVGSRAVWAQAKRRSVNRAIHDLAKKTVVMSDVEAAWLASFTSCGIIVISGTGSIAYGRYSDGKSARAGGLGPQKGDEGSGYWIGKKWLLGSEGAREQGGKGARKTVRDIAKKAPFVIQKARHGHSDARLIILEAQCHLAKLVHEIVQKLDFKGKVPISVRGSVLLNPWFRRGFLNELGRRNTKYKYVKPHTDTANALAHGLLPCSLAPSAPTRRSIMRHASR